jgi:branched-chain amino acid transport system permease protein
MMSLFAVAFALFSLVGMTPATAADDPVEYEYHFVGIVTYKEAPLEGVTMKVEGNGFSDEAVTGADGRWDIGVPDKGTYTITLDESTLPTGVAVTEQPGNASVTDTPNVQEKEFGVTKLAVINFFLGKGERHTTSFGDQLIERIINGINFGLMLALASIGLSLVFGTTGISNFAHGEMVTFGGIMTLAFSSALAWPIWTSIPAAVITSAVLGFVLDFILWKPLRKRGLGTVQLMIVSIGLSLTLRYIFQFFIGGGTSQLPGSAADKLHFGPIAITPISLWSMGVSLVVLVGVALWLQRTRIGKATRAVSDNPSLAAASGINVDAVVRIIWILGAGLAGLAGVLIAYFLPGVTWDMATGILLLIFASVTLGGLGTAYGALIGAMVVGMFVEISTLWIPTGIKYVGPLVVLIVVLLFRPQGILGRKDRIG